MKLKKIIYISPIIIMLAFILTSFVYIDHVYLYNPINAPKNFGYSWFTFKKPVNVECFSWSEQGDQIFYKPSAGDEDEARNILKQLDGLDKIEDFNQVHYLERLPKPRGKEYTILIRQTTDIDDLGFGQGRILIHATFFENDDVIKVEENFFKLTNTFKQHILSNYSEIVKIPTS